MNATEEWLNRLREWFARHPLKEPPVTLQRGYTEEVMRRIRTLEASAPVFRWVPRPRVAFALATVAVCALALIVVIPRTRKAQLAKPPASQPIPEPVQPAGQLVMVEGPALTASQPEWVEIEQMLRLLDRLEAEEGDGSSATPGDELSDEELLEELERLDRETLEASVSS